MDKVKIGDTIEIIKMEAEPNCLTAINFRVFWYNFNRKVNIIKERTAVIGKICSTKPILFDSRTSNLRLVEKSSDYQRDLSCSLYV